MTLDTQRESRPGRPAPDEYAPHFARYISLVPDGDLLEILDAQTGETLDLLKGIGEAESSFRYAPGKWSIKQVVGHVIDTERVFTYRALRFGRNDRTPLSSFEQDPFVAAAGFDDVPFADLVEELAVVRKATVMMLRHFPDDAWTRRGIANAVEMSTRAAAYVIAGHERYHREILKNNYLAR